MSTNKAELINTIKEWITLDNEIKELNKEIRHRKKKQQEKTKSLMEIMKSNEIDEFDITGGGKLIYSKQTIKKPITKKNLQSILSKYYNGDISQAIEMNNYIMSNREEVIKETIIKKSKPVENA